MVGITETFVLSGTKGMSVKVTVAENYDILSNTSDIAVTAEVISSIYSGHIYYLDGAVTAAEQTLRTMSSFGGTHFVYVQQTNIPYPIARGGGDTVDTPWELPNVVHEIDGSKTITVSVQLTGEEANGIGADGWTVTGSREIALTHIPRASTVAATNAVVGAVSMVAVNRKSSAYTHSIHYRFGNLTGYLSPYGLSATEVRFADTSIAFTVPESFYTQIPNAKSGSCLLTCRTYDGVNAVGEPTSGSFTVSTEETRCKPLLTGTVEDVNPATLALTADANILVRYASAAKCTITAQPRNSAAIAAKTIAGHALTGDTLTFNAIEGNTVVFAATDSRGYRTELAVEKRWVPYIHLTCHAEGKRTDPTSGNANLTISGDYYAGAFGAQANSLTLRYRIDDGSWTGITAAVKDHKYTAQVMLTGLTYTSAYTLEVQATDKLQTVSKSLVIGKGIPVFDWGEKDFAFHVPVTVHNGIYDPDGVGFAPAGHGLGETVPREVQSAENILASGFYTVGMNPAFGDPAAGAAVMTAITDGRYGNAHVTGMLADSCLIRNKWEGVWRPWEWVNPPMHLEAEYRTSERVVGKVVYRKAVVLGDVGPGTTNIRHNLQGFGGCVEIQLTAGAGVNITNVVSSSVDETYISLTTTGTYYGIVAYLRYVKG